MLRTRVIPVILIDGYSVLKTIRFDERRNLGNPVTVARTYNTRNVDELILLDINASREGRSIDLSTIEDIASECFMPLSIGGGLRSIEDIKKVLLRGADKVVINSAALENPAFIPEAVSYFGAQCIVGSVDFKKENNQYFVYKSGKIINKNPFEWVQELAKKGVGEIYINSVDDDGMMTGPDLNMIQQVTRSVSVPVIYSGGISSPNDYVEPLRLGCSAVAAASIFHFTGWTPDCVKRKLREQGFHVRL